MAEPLTPRARQIVAVARELLEEEGAEALTMRRLGARLGIRASSLYKHLPSKAALEAAIITVGSGRPLPPSKLPSATGPSRWPPSPAPTVRSRSHPCTGS